jgi:hypothetical protein
MLDVAKNQWGSDSIDFQVKISVLMWITSSTWKNYSWLAKNMEVIFTPMC